MYAQCERGVAALTGGQAAECRERGARVRATRARRGGRRRGTGIRQPGPVRSEADGGAAGDKCRKGGESVCARRNLGGLFRRNVDAPVQRQPQPSSAPARASLVLPLRSPGAKRLHERPSRPSSRRPPPRLTLPPPLSPAPREHPAEQQCRNAGRGHPLPQTQLAPWPRKPHGPAQHAPSATAHRRALPPKLRPREHALEVPRGLPS